MNKEEQLFQNRLIELSKTAYQRNIVTFTDFLSLNELNILHSTQKHMFPASYETYGGYESAERQIAAFLPDALSYEFHYPIQVLKIRPVNKKFAEQLTHRDYLGSVLNLGIERCKMGDIIPGGPECICFFKEPMGSYVRENLTRIRRTSVTAYEEMPSDVSYTPAYEELKGTVASIRLDTVLSVAFPLSRTKLTGLIEGGKVFVNGKLITSNGFHLKEKDKISIRGMGRVCYEGILSETKKGRFYITVHKYI